MNTIFGQTLTCPQFTATGTTTSPYSTPSSSGGSCNAVCPQALNTNAYPWDGGSSSGSIVATSLTPVTVLALGFNAVNTNDYATITVNGGGTVSLTGSGCGISGNVIGPYNCSGYGDVFVTVHSTLPFTIVTINNTGGSSGWVINCPGSTPNAGLDYNNLSSPICGGTLNLNTVLSSGADAGGVWVETTSSGQFTPGTGVFNASGLAAGTYTFTYTVTSCGSTDIAIIAITVGSGADAGTDNTSTLCNTTGTTLNLNTLLTGADPGGTWVETTSSGQFTPGTGIFNAAGLAGGNYTFTYTVLGSTPCPNDVANFTVTVNPIPVYTVTGTNPSTCSGTDGYLTISGLTPNASYSVSYTKNGVTVGPNNLISNASGIITISNLSGGTYTSYSISSAAGCTAANNTIVTLASALAPTVNAGIDKIICLGDNVTLTATNPNGATISWNNGITDGVAFSVTTTMTFTVTADLSGCTATDQVVVTVNPLPTINAGIDQTLCAGTPVTLNASGAGTGTYTWNNGVPNNVPFTQTSGTTTYTVSGTDANGCINTDAVDVTVNSIPVVNAGTDQSVCIGTQVTLTATGSTTYSWDNSITNGVTFTPALGTITYTVIGTTSNCTSTDQVIVTVNPIPNVTATTDTILCEHQTIILVGSGASNYSWNNGITNGVAFTPTGTGTYTVIGTDPNGCKNTDSVLITIIPTPLADFVSDKFIGCSPLAFNLTNNSIGNLTNCKWTLSNGQTFNGCGPVTDTLLAVGCYDVTLVVTTPQGCTNTMTKSNYICVAPDPVAKFYTDPNELSTFISKANMTNVTIGATSYEWNFGDNTGNSTETNPSHEFPNDEGKTYTITLIATSDIGCVDTTTETITVIEDLIYYVPNTFTPDADNFNETFLPVFTSGYDPQDYVLLIFDRWGEILFESHNAKVGWDGTFNGKMTPDATYIWKISFKLKNKDERQEHIGNVNLLR